MGIEINLIRAWQIIIVDLEYTSYVKEEVERRITRIEQIHCTTTYFFVFYDIKIKRNIKRRHRKQARMLKGIIQTEAKRGGVFQSSFVNHV